MATDRVFDIRGASKGVTSFVLAGVHGNETCGVQALQRALPQLKIDCGRILLAFGNPLAIERNVRHVDADLNRMFKDDFALTDRERNSYECRRAQELKPLLAEADVLLDIHASTTPTSLPFVICESNGYDLAGHLPAARIVSGFDAIQPGGTDYYMNKIGKIGLCIECGYLGDPESTAIAEKALSAFLRARGHTSGVSFPQNQSRIVVRSQYLTRADRFVPDKTYEDFEPVAAGARIGVDGDQGVYCQEDSVILFARPTQAKGEEAFVLGRIA